MEFIFISLDVGADVAILKRPRISSTRLKIKTQLGNGMMVNFYVSLERERESFQ